ncbi:MAG: glycosyltransferase family A protein [Eggerthellales bacterium]|nr:glycosyltransferase family A protein [Eggerthellales bacterium]
MKVITFAVPCFNSAAYMDACIESLLACDMGFGDVEILIVNDGSAKDNTAEIADGWQERYPDIIKAIHKTNGGHGSAVNTGLANATGLYYKVVDSDDWLDLEAMKPVMALLRAQADSSSPLDMVIGNYVYEKVFEHAQVSMGYVNVFPQGREFGWDEIGRFNPSQYLLMHSVIYRTQLLRDCGLVLPEHTFYVDNIFVYVPLPHVKTMYYLNVDMYRYFIGREDQSVNEKVMYGRRDQQVRVTKCMTEAVNLSKDVPSEKLRKYMENYLAMMYCITSVFLRLEHTPENDAMLADIWQYLKDKDPELHGRIRHNILNMGVNLPGEVGRRIGIGGYRIAQRLFKFN